MVDSRKSIDAGKNEISPTTEHSTIENQIIDRAFNILPWRCIAFAMLKVSLVVLGVMFDQAW
jgi:hypothetical protein